MAKKNGNTSDFAEFEQLGESSTNDFSEFDELKKKGQEKPLAVGSENGGQSTIPVQDLPLAYEESKAGLFDKLAESIQTPQEKSGFRTVQEMGKAKLPSGVTMEKTQSKPIDFDAEDRRIEAEQKEQREVARLNVKDKYETIKPKLDEFKGIISQQKSDLDAQYNYTRQTLDELKRADQLDINAPDVSELVQSYDRLGKETEEKNKQLKNIENAELFVKELENIINGKNKKFSEGVYQSIVKKLAFDGIAEIKRNFDLKKISDKIANGEDITADEQLAIASYGLLNEAQSNFQSGIGYDVGSSLVEMIPYLFSFAVSGGVSKGIQAGIMGALKSTGEKTTKELVKKGVAYTTGQLVRPAFFSSLYSSGIEKQIGQVETTKDLLSSIAEGTKESPQKAFAKAYANTMAEVMTEQLGEVAVPMFNKIIGREVKQALNPTIIDKIKDATAFNGFLPEMGEEFANEVLSTAIEGRPAEEIFDPRKILTTALTVGIMSSGFALSNTAYKAVINKKEQESGLKFDTKTKKQIDAIIESDKDIEEKGKELSYIIDEKIKSGAKNDEISNIVQYATSHTAKMKMDEVELEIQKGVENKAQDEVKPPSDTKIPPKEKVAENEEKAIKKPIEEKPIIKEDDPAVEISGRTKASLSNGRKKQVVEFDENGSPIVKEIDFTRDDADVELDRLELLAQKGKLTTDKFQSSYFGQSADLLTFQAAIKAIENDATGFIQKLREAFTEEPIVEPKISTEDKVESFEDLENRKLEGRVRFAEHLKQLSQRTRLAMEDFIRGENITPDEYEKLPQKEKDTLNEKWRNSSQYKKLTEEPTNAEKVRSNQGQNDQGGIIPPESNGESIKDVKQPKEADAKITAEKDRVNIHNRLVGLVKTYNTIPHAHNKKKGEAFKEINNIVARMGYSLGQKEGKLSVTKNGKPIRKISIPRTKEELQSHKALTDYENKDFVDFVNLLGESPVNVLSFYDTGIKKDKIPQAIEDIKAGVKNANSNDLLDYLEKFHEAGEVTFYDPGSRVTLKIPIEDFKKSLKQSEDVSPQEEDIITDDDAAEVNRMIDDFYEGNLPEKDFDKIRDMLFNENSPYTEEDFNNLKEQYNDEQQAKREEEGSDEIEEDNTDSPIEETGKNEESAAAKETRVKLDQEIIDQEALLKDAISRKNKKIAEFNSRNGMFGDTQNEKEGKTLLDVNTEFSQNTLGKFISKEEGEIRILKEKIATLKKNKEAKIKEAGGQKEISDKDIRSGKTDLGYSSLSPGNKSLDDLAQERTRISEGKDFLISERVKTILKELGVPIAEKYLPKKYLGLFKHKGRNIRVQSIIDVVVATHETGHHISRAKGIGMKIRTNNGMGKIREALTRIYVEFYPNAKVTHSLEKRVEEGYAVLLEHYFAEPTYITEKYPQLVNAFIKPDGIFYDPMVGTLLDRMNELVDDYARLSPEQKIGSRIIHSDDVVKRDKGFTWAQKFIYEHFNRFEPFSRVGKIADVSGEFKDPFVHAFQWMNRGTFIHDWIKGNAKMVLKKDGNWETRPGTVRDYLREITGLEKEFDTFLVSRRVLEDYNNLTDAKNRLAALKEQYDSMVAESEDIEVAEEAVNAKEIDNLKTVIDDVEKEIEKLSTILVKDGFNTNDASAVVRKYEKRFQKAVDIYDGITKAMIDFSENTGLITSTIAAKYRESKGYAPFFRFINDELLPENAGNSPSTNSQTKAKIFKQRTGSKYDIVSPVYNQMLAISEVIGKGLENNIWVNVAKVANSNVEIARRFEEMNTQVAIDEKGNVSYPQDTDKNLMKVWVNGKRRYFKIAPEFAEVAKNLRGEEWGAFRKLIQLPSATFTRLTTSANPLFALGNITIDQLSAYMQSKTGFIPGVSTVDSFVEMIKATTKLNSDEETLFRKYIRLGGRRQTFAAFHELSPEKTIAKVEGASTFEQAIEKMDLGLTFLELPSNMSEYMTRFAEYKRAINQGRTETEAMFMASQITTPFQLYGNWYGDIGKSWIKALPYFNAAMQVNYKFFKTVKDQPGKVALMSAALLSTSLSMAFLVMSQGSDEQKRLLANMPARELARAVFFPNPWNKRKLIRIRVPENIGAFTGLAYLYAIQMGTKQQIRYKDYVDSATAFIPDQFNVLDPTKLIFSWVPQVLSPSIETAANIKTYPNLSPIVPDYLLENYPPELQYTEYATKTAISMGKLMNISPMKIDYWIRNQFGVIGGAAIGRMPNNPLVREEQNHVTTGRSYSYFYDDKVHSSQEYNFLKNKKNYSDKEKETAAREYVLYNKMGNVLSNMRRTIQANKGLPEPIKEQSFQLLVRINNGERGTEIHSEMESLNKNILDFVYDSNLDIGRQYTVTVENINESMDDYINKVLGDKEDTGGEEAR